MSFRNSFPVAAYFEVYSIASRSKVHDNEHFSNNATMNETCVTKIESIQGDHRERLLQSAYGNHCGPIGKRPSDQKKLSGCHNGHFAFWTTLLFCASNSCYPSMWKTKSSAWLSYASIPVPEYEGCYRELCNF